MKQNEKLLGAYVTRLALTVSVSQTKQGFVQTTFKISQSLRKELIYFESIPCARHITKYGKRKLDDSELFLPYFDTLDRVSRYKNNTS